MESKPQTVEAYPSRCGGDRSLDPCRGEVEVAINEAIAIAFINKEAAVEELYHTILTAREVTGSSWIP